MRSGRQNDRLPFYFSALCRKQGSRIVFCLGEEPVAKRFCLGLFQRLGRIDNIVCEIDGKAECERPDEPARRDVIVGEDAAAEHDTFALDRCLQRQLR